MMFATVSIAISCLVILSLLFIAFDAPSIRSLTPLQLSDTNLRRHHGAHHTHRADGRDIDHTSSVDSVSLTHTNALLNEWSAHESDRVRQMIYSILLTFDDTMNNAHSRTLCHRYTKDKKHGGLYYDDVYQVYWTGGGSNSDARIVTALQPDDCDVCAADTGDTATDISDDTSLPSSSAVIKTECRLLCNDITTVRQCWICQRLDSGLTLDTGITVEHTTNIDAKQIDHVDKIMSSMFSQVADDDEENVFEDNTLKHNDDNNNNKNDNNKPVTTYPSLFFQNLQSDYYQIGRLIYTLFKKPIEMNTLYPYHFTQEAIASNDHSIRKDNDDDNDVATSTTHSHITYESQPVTEYTKTNRPTLKSESSPFDAQQPYAVNSDAVVNFLSRLHPHWFESIDGGGGGGGGMGYQLICSEEHVIIDSVDRIRTTTFLTTGGGGGAGYRLHGNSRDDTSKSSSVSDDSNSRVAAGVLLPPSTSQSFAPRYAQMKFNGGAGTGAGLQLSTMRDDADDRNFQLNVGGGGGGGLTFEVRSVDPVDPDYQDSDGEEYADRDGTVEVNNIVYEFGSTPDDSVVLPPSDQVSILPTAIAKRMRLCMNRGGALRIRGGGGGGGGQHYHLHLTKTTTAPAASHHRSSPRVDVFTHSALGFHFEYIFHRRSPYHKQHGSSSPRSFCVTARPFPDRNIVEKRIERTVNEVNSGESSNDATIRAKYQQLAADEATLGFYGAEVARLITKCLQRSRTSSSSASLPTAGTGESSESTNYYTQTLCPCLRNSFRTVLKKHKKRVVTTDQSDNDHTSNDHHRRNDDDDDDDDGSGEVKDPSEYNNPFMNCRVPPKRPDRQEHSSRLH